MSAGTAGLSVSIFGFAKWHKLKAVKKQLAPLSSSLAIPSRVRRQLFEDVVEGVYKLIWYLCKGWKAQGTVNHQPTTKGSS